MTDPLSISLRAWPAPDKTVESLPYLIARINEQKGSFRNVTEASLEEEILAAEVGESQESDDTEQKDAVVEGHHTKAKGDELATAREEIIKQVGVACTASSHALDFISLLLSKYNPKVVEATMSQPIKEMVPLGSLGVEKMQEPSRSEAEKVTEDMVGLGWRLQSLTRSADSLLNSTTRLGEEMEHEATYWQQILSVKETGWSICRVPGDPHTLGVRFGFAEAHAEFRDRGLAALRRDPNGNIRLDRGPRWQGNKYLRVRLLRAGKSIATSSPRNTSSDEDRSLPESLTRARNSLFDEELYHELNREARNLVNQEVRCVGNAIHFPFQEDTQVKIDLVPLAEEEEESQEDSTIPTAIAMALRVFLSYAHRENLARRSQPPAPMSDTPPPRRVYPLLRPILEIDQHDSAVKATQKFLSDLESILSAASLPFSIEESSFSLLPSLMPSELPQVQGSTVETLVSRFIRPHHTQIKFCLPSERSNLKLDIHTSIFPPAFGTSFQLSTVSSIPGSALANMPQTFHFSTINKLMNHLFSLTAFDIMSLLQEHPDIEPSWTRRSLWQPEITRRGLTHGQKDKASVIVDEEGLKLECVCRGKSSSHTWRSSETDAAGPKQGFVDVLKELVS